MTLFPEFSGTRFFATATNINQQLAGLILNQNDLLPIVLQVVDPVTSAAKNMSGWSVSVVIVNAPSGSGIPTQLALQGLTLAVDNITFNGTIQLNTVAMAAFIGLNPSASAVLAVLATKNDTTQEFEVQLPIQIQGKAYNTGSVAPTAPSGTTFFFNSTSNRWEWYVNGSLVMNS